MYIEAWNELTYTFLNFKGCTIEVWEWISIFVPHFIMDVITYGLESKDLITLCAGIKVKPC